MHSNKGRRVAANERWRMALRYNKFDMKEVAVLGESKDDVMRSRERCKADGIPVYGEFVWEGPVPPDSYMMVAPTVPTTTALPRSGSIKINPSSTTSITV